jgi:peptide/nickel transport system ATP-binding protein/oligopeptide transport system ATP-binding protein
MDMADTILEVKNLAAYFYIDRKPVAAVDGVDFSLRTGKTLGIVGESGCGKSVTSLSILKLLPQKTSFLSDETSIVFQGEELKDKTNKQMRRIRGNEIAMIFQDSLTSLNPVMTIEAQMIEPFRIHKKMARKQARESALEMLKKVGIPSPESRLRAYPHQLSGGMRQRILIAMALSCSPKILIADEPTTALDVTIQAQILNLMRELKKSIQTSIILITHDMGVVAEMADDILVMYAGNVVEYSHVEGIFKNPLHPYTKGLLTSIPRWDKSVEKLNSIAGSVPSLDNMPRGCRFCDRCTERSEQCRLSRPPLFNVGKRKVRCFLYENMAENND